MTFEKRSQYVARLPAGALDAHVHPWRLTDLPPVIQGAREARPDLARDYPPENVVSVVQESGCSGVILVNARDQHEDSQRELEFFVDAAAAIPQIRGAVVGIDLLAPHKSGLLLAELRKNCAIRGARMIAPENAGVGILSDPRAVDTAVLLGEAELALDLLIRSSNPGQLEEAVSFVKRVADRGTTKIVGDHLLKPMGIAEGRPQNSWIDALKELAEIPLFFLKLSGLAGEVAPGSDRRSFFPFYDCAFELLGCEKLIFGSDYPVSYGHADAVHSVTAWLNDRGLLQESISEQIFLRNAERAYRLEGL